MVFKEGHKVPDEWRKKNHDRAKFLIGNKSPNWKGGITPLTQKIRLSEKYKQWMSDILQRDKWTCQTCQKRGVRLEVHHIKTFIDILTENSVKTFDEAMKCRELWLIDNGVTLCKECHNLTKKGRNV
jgi:hypothetical protein